MAEQRGRAAATAPEGASDSGEKDPGKDLGTTEGGNPAKDDKRAGRDATPAGGKMARANAAEVAAVIATEPAETRGDNGAALVRVDDAEGLEDLLEDAGGEAYVTLTKDVVEEFFYPDTKRPSHRVLFHKGQVVARSVIEQRAQTIRAAQAKGGGPETFLDASTLASGTNPGASAL